MRCRGVWGAWAVVLVCLVAAGTAAAQEQTGSIQGTVKDSSGGVLPGATVEARNTAMAGVSTAVSDAQGVYRFPALSPGVYAITATLQGFTPAKTENVTLSLGQLLTVNLALSVGAVSETVEVTGEPPLIDVKQAASFTTVSQDVIDRIPKGRDFATVVATAAGAQDESRAGGIQVDGSSGSENRFIVDGMDTTNLRTGVQGKTMLLDFVQEVQVKSSGYNAEFGGSTGGVISAAVSEVDVGTGLGAWPWLWGAAMRARAWGSGAWPGREADTSTPQGDGGEERDGRHTGAWGGGGAARRATPCRARRRGAPD